MLKRTLTAFLLGAATLRAVPAIAEVIPYAAEKPIHHVVIIWLKDAGNPAAREQYIAQSRRMSKLPMVKEYRVGTVLSGGREIVDTSYDVAVVATFANQQALKDYLDHPEHKKVVEEALKPLVAKAVVYDFAEAP